MPQQLIPMVAREDLSNEGTPVAKGEYFEAKPIHAAALKYKNRAVFTDKREPEPEPEPPKRRYRRRDVQAEE
jgi:hypothetical protein